FENKLRRDTAVFIELQRNIGSEAESIFAVRSMKCRATLANLDFMRGAAIVERRETTHRESHGAAHASYSSVELMIERRIGVESDGHKVFELCNAVFMRKPCYQDIRRWPVKLFV